MSVRKEDLLAAQSEIVVAVLDTGITDHSELRSSLLPGADFISDSRIAGDGNGRDGNPQDEGDWIDQGDSCYQGRFIRSSWHGTHVAGIISAMRDNSRGIAGFFSGVRVLPVRVLGKCGGPTSDIADAIRWASGLNVSGMAPNQNPAQVINLSLGAVGSCGRTMQAAIDAAILNGSVVVVAAGNDNANIDFQSFTPANCRGVITVGATDDGLAIPQYSNYGNGVEIFAPGGDYYRGIHSTVNSGTTLPVNSESYKELNGTSMSAPFVSATVAMMMSLNPELYPMQYLRLLEQTATRLSSTKMANFNFLSPRRAVEMAQMTTPDDSALYVPQQPVISGGGIGLFRPQEDQGSGCGSVAFIDRDNDKDGPGSDQSFGQKMSFLLGLLLALILSLFTKKDTVKVSKDE